MLIKILLAYLFGYLQVVVEGYYIERFMNLCKNQKITIWNLKRNEEIRLSFKIGINEYKKACKIAKKTKCKIKISNKKGIPFLLNKYKKRKMFGWLLIVLIILIGLSSQFVWNVDIIEENGQELENILQDIENAGLKSRKIKNKS